MYTVSGLEVEGSKGAANKSYIRHSTFGDASGSISRSLFLPIRVANQRKTNQCTTRESRRSPIGTMTMMGCWPSQPIGFFVFFCFFKK